MNAMKVWMSMHCNQFDHMIQDIILSQIGLPHDKINKNDAIQGGRCVVETQYKETIVFGSHYPIYDTTSDWLGLGTKITPYREPTVFWKRHT